MFNLVVGVAQVSLYFRHAQSLKDKRQVLRGVIQKLKNQGFSVTESGHPDSAKQGSVAFAYVSTSANHVEKCIGDGLRLFDHGCEVLSSNYDVFDYSGDDAETFSRVLSEEGKGEGF